MCVRSGALTMSIDNNLLLPAQKIAGIKTKKDAGNQALREFIKRRKQEEIIQLFGQIEYSKDYDYKGMRSRNSSVSSRIYRTMSTGICRLCLTGATVWPVRMFRSRR